MTSDRKLLELAAKAAGIEFGSKRCTTGRPDLYLGPTNESRGWWNALIDDGDALRLAVKLHLTIDRSEIDPAAHIYCDWQDADIVVNEPHGDDPYAATRRAIVRAAAEIGRGMK